eukprot:Stramenopile-MAST_4_protein_1095
MKYIIDLSCAGVSFVYCHCRLFALLAEWHFALGANSEQYHKYSFLGTLVYCRLSMDSQDTKLEGTVEICIDTDGSKQATLASAVDIQQANLRAMSTVVEPFHNITEVIEFAKYLGIDPNKESSLLWIAQEAIKAPLPDGWTDHTDESGNVYFYNTQTERSTWVHPLDDHYKTLVKRLQRTGQIKRPQVNSPVVSPMASKVKQPAFELPLDANHSVSNKKYANSNTNIKKQRSRKPKRIGRRRDSGDVGLGRDEYEFDSHSSSCMDDETSATDTDAEQVSRRSRRYRGDCRDISIGPGRMNSPLLRRSSKRDVKKKSSRHRLFADSNAGKGDYELDIHVESKRQLDDQTMDGTKSKDELQKLLSLAQSRGQNPTDMAMRIMLSDGRIKCALCCFCLCIIVAVTCFLVLKFIVL